MMGKQSLFSRVRKHVFRVYFLCMSKYKNLLDGHEIAFMKMHAWAITVMNAFGSYFPTLLICNTANLLFIHI